MTALKFRHQKKYSGYNGWKLHSLEVIWKTSFSTFFPSHCCFQPPFCSMIRATHTHTARLARLMVPRCGCLTTVQSVFVIGDCLLGCSGLADLSLAEGLLSQTCSADMHLFMWLIEKASRHYQLLCRMDSI